MMPSNYSKDGYFYLLNAPPGRYAAVATFRSQSSAPAGPPSGGGGVSVSVHIGSTEYATYFDEKLIALTEIDVTSGSFGFMGDFEVDTTTSFKEADATQLYFYRLLAPGHENASYLEEVLSGDYQYCGSHHETEETEAATAAFRKSAKKRLSEAGWTPDNP